jgi:hypothetical protein
MIYGASDRTPAAKCGMNPIFIAIKHFRKMIASAKKISSPRDTVISFYLTVKSGKFPPRISYSYILILLISSAFRQILSYPSNRHQILFAMRLLKMFWVAYRRRLLL